MTALHSNGATRIADINGEAIAAALRIDEQQHTALAATRNADRALAGGGHLIDQPSRVQSSRGHMQALIDQNEEDLHELRALLGKVTGKIADIEASSRAASAFLAALDAVALDAVAGDAGQADADRTEQ